MDMLNRKQFSLSAYFSGLEEKENLSEWKQVETLHQKDPINYKKKNTTN